MKKISLSIIAISIIACNTQKNVKADYTVNKNETFDVTLKSNPTTGYAWKWKKNNSSKIVDSISATYVQDKAEPGMTGVGGNEIYKFKGKESGIDTLVFEYCRSWEKNPPAETKKVIVKVN